MKSRPLNPVPNPETWWLYVLEYERGVLYTGTAIFTRLNPPLRILAQLRGAERR